MLFCQRFHSKKMGRVQGCKHRDDAHLRGHPRPEEEMKRLQNRAMEGFSAYNLAGEFYEMVRRAYTRDTKKL